MLGSSAATLELMWPRIDRTPMIARTTTKLDCTFLGSSALGRAQYGKRLLTAWTWFLVSQLD
jgi:hypothetical protein